MTSKTYLILDSEFSLIIKNSDSCAEAMRKLGYSCIAGNARITVYRRIKELHLDTTHWNDNTKKAHLAIKLSHDKYFAKNTPHSGGHLRERILKENLLEYKCAICGNSGTWNNSPLVLQIDHINGDHNDNRLENLRFLCPNCHSQTDTFAGKNVKH